MGVFDKCCFCVTLRVGCIHLAVSRILPSFCFFIAFHIGLINGGPELKVINISNIITVVACISLIVGVIEYNSIAMLVYLILEMIQIVLAGVAIVWWFIVLSTALLGPNTSNEDKVAVAIDTAIGIALVIGFLVSIYLLLCAYSFYKKIKQGQIGPQSRV